MHRWFSSPDSVSRVYLSIPVPIAHHVNYCSSPGLPCAGRLGPNLASPLEFAGLLWAWGFLATCFGIGLFWNMIDKAVGSWLSCPQQATPQDTWVCSPSLSAPPGSQACAESTFRFSENAIYQGLTCDFPSQPRALPTKGLWCSIS